jgi:hypothetical protein
MSQLLYLEGVVVQKLYEEKICLRNIVGHIGLGKQLRQLIQTEGDLVSPTPNQDESEGFSGNRDWDPETSETIEACFVSDKFAALLLNDHEDG